MFARLTVQCVQFDNLAFSIFFSTSQPDQPYDNLDEDKKEKVRALLFIMDIMDRFSISMEGDHELTQVEKSLPRTNLIESCTMVLDSRSEVTRIPGDNPGAELLFKLLLENEVGQQKSCTTISFDLCI